MNRSFARSNAERTSTWHPRLQLTFKIGAGLILLQLAIFLIFSEWQAQHYNLEQDYAQFGQAWYLFAHFDFQSVVTIKTRPFYRDHGDFFFYLLTPLWYIWPHTVTLMWVQDVFATIAEIAALRWMHEHLHRTRATDSDPNSTTLIAVLGGCLLVFNPMIFWAIANDFHTEIFAVAFLVLAARAFYLEKPIAWLWVFGVILNGNVSASYLVGIALSMVLAGRKYWKYAIGVLAVAGVSTEIATLIGADEGSSFRGYQYLNGVNGTAPTSTAEVLKLLIKHPFQALGNLFNDRLAGFALVSVSGLLGVISPWALGITLVCFVEAGFSAWPILTPSYAFQNFAILIFVPIGTVMALVPLMVCMKSWVKKAALGFIALELLWVFGWFAVWAPETPNRWVTIPTKSSVVLRQAESLIPEADEVVASQGIVGAFSLRKYIYMFDLETNSGKKIIPLDTKTVWMLVTPNLGIELQTPESAYKMISKLQTLEGMDTVIHREGVYLLKWNVPQGTPNPFVLDFRDTAVNPLLLNSVGYRNPIDPNGKSGYILNGYYQIISRPQKFRYSVELKSDGPLVIEVWNSSTDTLLSRQSIVSTNNEYQTFHLDASISKITGQKIWNGIWPFKSQVERPYYEGDALELRIFDSGATRCEIRSIMLKTQFSTH